MSALLSLEQTRETMRKWQLGQLCAPLASGVGLSTERIHRDQHDYAWTFSPWFLVLKGADTCRHSHAVAIERVSTQSLPKNGSFRPGAKNFRRISPRLPISGVWRPIRNARKLRHMQGFAARSPHLRLEGVQPSASFGHECPPGIATCKNETTR